MSWDPNSIPSEAQTLIRQLAETLESVDNALKHLPPYAHGPLRKDVLGMIAAAEPFLRPVARATKEET